MRKVIYFIVLMKEVSFIFDIHISKPEVFCKVIKDNKSSIAAVESNKFSTRSKRINIKYHHFQSFVKNKIIQICCIDTQEQTAKIFTKLLDGALFTYLQIKLYV